MSNWSVTTTVPTAWSEICNQGDSLFHSEEWLALLERSLGCSSLYFLRDDHQQAAGMSLFRAGPFRVGYLGFPIGGVVGSGTLTTDFVEQMRTAGGLPVAVRMPVSGFSAPVELDLPYEATSETAIVDLQAWQLSNASTNRRRDVRRSQRSELVLVDAQESADAKVVFELYRKTLERHHGSLRYTTEYFDGLIRLSREHPNLRVMLAMNGASIAAFTVVALHGSSGFYLHGAIDWSQRDLRPAALLMNEAIEWVKARNGSTFSFLSSPQGQKSLIRYKEAWGAETREHRTYTLPLKSTYLFFKVAERLYRILR